MKGFMQENDPLNDSLSKYFQIFKIASHLIKIEERDFIYC